MAANKKAKAEEIDLEAESEEQAALNEQLRLIKDELFKLNEEASDKVLEIEQQYSKKRRPIYDARAEILKQIPQFWQTALLKHPDLNASATEDDAAILSYCTELNVEDYEDIKSGYRIIFRFSSDNIYFSNEELVKSYSYQEGGHLKVESTKPLWKAGYEPPEPEPEEDFDFSARAHKRRAREGPDYKLFLWFMAEDEVVLSATTDDVADIIKEEIWPDPIKYYEGELSEDLDLEIDEGEAEFDEEGEELRDKVDGEGADGEGEEVEIDGEGGSEDEEDAS